VRRAYNLVTSAHERRFCDVFDAPSSTLPLEGKTGSGDSGGPVLVDVDGQWALAGLVAWGFIQCEVRSMRPGLYGQLTCNGCVGHDADWIKSVMAGGAYACR
jgi:secreted trypsin-like serine protease